MRTTIMVAADRMAEFKILLADAVADSIAEVDDPQCGTLGYAAHFNEETGELVLFEHHDSFEALVAHLRTGPDRRAAMREMCVSTGTTEIYGPAPEALIRTLTDLAVDPVVYATTFGVSGAL